TQSQASAEHKHGGHSNNIKAVIFFAKLVTKNSPPDANNQANLFHDARETDYISHESSSGVACCEESRPTMEKKICSSVIFSPSLPLALMPARSSSKEPWATRRPLLIIPTWLHSRSTISR